MKFSIRELMVLTLAVASVVGWIADRRRLCDAFDKAEQKSEEAALKIRELKEVNLVVATAGAKLDRSNQGIGTANRADSETIARTRIGALDGRPRWRRDKANSHETLVRTLEGKMKFSIRDVLLVTVIVALAVGWWVDHRRQEAKNEQTLKAFDPLHRAPLPGSTK